MNETAGFEISEAVPKPQEYCDLRVTCGLSEKSIDSATKGLPLSLYSITIRDSGTLIGMGRVVGDGLHVQVVDIAIHPDYQKKGLSRIILERIVNFVNTEISSTATVSLFADVDWLYEKFGFAKPQKSQGMFLKRKT